MYVCRAAELKDTTKLKIYYHRATQLSCSVMLWNRVRSLRTRKECLGDKIVQFHAVTDYSHIYGFTMGRR